MPVDKSKKDPKVKTPPQQQKQPDNLRAQLQEESLKVHGDKLEHPKSKE
jgi:hypothetical protein